MPLFTYQESSGAKKAASAERQGVGSSGSNVVRMFSRPSLDYVKPPGSPLWTKVSEGIEAAAEGGIPCHNALTGAYQPCSSLYPTAGGWTLTAGSGSAAYDTTIYMFDESIQPLGPRSIKLVGGAAATPTAMAPVSLNVATVTTLRLRVWARHEAASDLEWALYSSRAAKWWNPALSTFTSAAAVWTDVGHVTGDDVAFVVHEFVIDKGATVSPDTLQMTLRQNANGKTAYVGSADLVTVFGDTVGHVVDWGFPSGPPFPQDAVTVAGTRPVPVIRLHQEGGIIAPDAGTIFITVDPDFTATLAVDDSSVLTFGSLTSLAPPYLWLMHSNSDDKFGVYWNTGGGSHLLFKVMGAPTPPWHFAVVYQGSTRFRQASESLTIELYTNGVLLGSAALDAELFSAAACKDAWIGAANGFSLFSWSGVVRDLAFSPYIWTPAQIAARAAL